MHRRPPHAAWTNPTPCEVEIEREIGLMGIEILDANRVLNFNRFKECLRTGTAACTGFIAVLAEWIKLVGAAELEEIKQYPACTTFDTDSLWRSLAIPPAMMCGHAFASLSQNPVSRENKDMQKRLGKFTYQYCHTVKDMLSIATPWRWPLGSPALRSLVIRIKPMILPFGRWRGGSEFDTIMYTAWDTVNNWGLRSGINEAAVHSFVPYYAWDTPLKEGSGQNQHWGMEAIIADKTIVCVNQLWQTSKHQFGPSARDARSWKPGSLVRITYVRTEFDPGAGTLKS